MFSHVSRTATTMGLAVMLVALPALTTLPAAAQSSSAAVTARNASVEEKTSAGQLAASGWLLQLDRGDWGGSWESASLLFRTSVPLSQWMDGVPQMRRPFGRFMERTAADSNYKDALPGRPNGDYVTTRFVTDFSERKGVEEFVTAVLDADGRWRVAGYTAR